MAVEPLPVTVRPLRPVLFAIMAAAPAPALDPLQTTPDPPSPSPELTARNHRTRAAIAARFNLALETDHDNETDRWPRGRRTRARLRACVRAQSHHHGHGTASDPRRLDHSAHGSSKPKGDTGPSSLAYHAINAKMHEGMDITFTGNADIDFARGMIPHHQGAVDMAKTVIAFGKDPQLRKLAEEIIKAQETEIALMQTGSSRTRSNILKNQTARRMPGGSIRARPHHAIGVKL